ncbi:MAG: hypothetical protein H0W18_10225 [Acidobacteria bacterium]|nr:hypothetical protein [Acidobacteriota bacterium]
MDLVAALKLHHSIPTPDGRTGICVWEGPSISALQTFLDPMLGPDARNEYCEVVNRASRCRPRYSSRLTAAALKARPTLDVCRERRGARQHVS